MILKFPSKIARFTRLILATTLLINLMGGASLAMAKTIASSIEVDAVDTVAGYSALIRAFNAPSNTNIELKIEKPDGAEIILEATTDRTGKTKFDLEGFYTRKAGTYTVEARIPTRDEAYGPAATFTVYADTLSPSRSLLQLNRQTASANGNEPVEVQVTLLDQYANPLSGHTVQLISSRKSDEIVRLSSLSYTNEQGRMVFNVYSRQAGVSTLIVSDTTANMALNERGQIAFYSPGENPIERGGNTNSPRVYFASTSDSGPASYLAIENLSETVKIGETQSITVVAMDSQGNAASNYTGTIHFASSDNNATLPNDYAFEAEDQGRHTFSLGATFKTMGAQTLTVTDLSDEEIYVETGVNVTASGTGQSNAYGEPIIAGDLTVLSPVLGTYSSDNLSFSGEALYGMKIEIHEDDILKGEIEVEPEGTFTAIIKDLGQGEHEFVVSTVDEDGEIIDQTEPFLVTIDTNAPTVDKVEILPQGAVAAGSDFSVTVYSEPNLPQVAVIFNNGVFQLEEDSVVNGSYHGTLKAPETQKEYVVDILVVDDLGNEILYNQLADVTVGEPEAEEELVEEEIVNPGTVEHVEAVSGDGQVTLSWEAPAALNPDEEPTSIDHYRIYYGPDAELLYSSVNTQNSSPTWRVENLQNGNTYYFAVVAVTAENVESLEKSETVSAMPESDDTAALLAAAAEAAARKAQEEALAKAMTEDAVDTGPEIIWLMSMSGGLGGLYFGRRRKKKVVFHDIR